VLSGLPQFGVELYLLLEAAEVRNYDAVVVHFERTTAGVVARCFGCSEPLTFEAFFLVSRKFVDANYIQSRKFLPIYSLFISIFRRAGSIQMAQTMNFRFAITMLASCLLSFSAFGQDDFRKGFIVTLENDTIQGLINFNVKDRCEFRESKTSENIVFNPGDLKGYGYIKQRHYESWLIPETNEPMFIELIQRGKVSLYFHDNYFLVHRDSLLALKKGKDRIVEVEGKKYIESASYYKQVLNFMLQDCPPERLVKLTYTERHLNNAIRKYNQCTGNQPFIPKSDVDWIRINFWVTAGLTRSKLQLTNFDPSVFGASRSLVYGFGGLINSPRLNEKISFTAGLFWTNVLYQGLNNVNDGSSRTTQDIFIESGFYKVPFGIRYSLSTNSTSPYLKLGLLLGGKRKTSNNIIQETELQNGDVYTDLFAYQLKNSTTYGLFGSVGYEKKIFDRLKLYSEIMYEQLPGADLYRFEYGSSITNLSFLVGFSY